MVPAENPGESNWKKKLPWQTSSPYVDKTVDQSKKVSDETSIQCSSLSVSAQSDAGRSVGKK
jgi:hypothetical protein